MESYTELKQRHGEEMSEFPICFAFSDKQLNEALEKLGAEIGDCVSIGAGSVLRKSDIKDWKKLTERHQAEREAFLSVDPCLIEAIVYELGNHEYGYTWDTTDATNALGLDMKDERVEKCLEKAKTIYCQREAAAECGGTAESGGMAERRNGRNGGMGAKA